MPTAQEHGYPRDAGTMATLKRTLREFKEDNLTDWAAALTYYGVLALFPALIALVSIVGLVFSPQQITSTLTETISQIGPASSVETLQGPIQSVAGDKGRSGVLLVVGIVGALWSASGYVGAFMRASNVMYEVDEGRPIWKLRPLQMLVTLIMVLLLAVAAVAVVITGPLAEAVGGAVGLGDTAVTIWDIAKWPVLLAVVMLMVAVLYYASPNAKLRGFRWITPGSVVAVLVWIVASVAFAFYVANFGSYDKTYGTLGGVISFLVWLWITNVAILFGAQLNAERERSVQFEEGTAGAERELRLGERDAPKDKARPRSA
ncbi:MAG TPA: YihY/virulence factor BrkB family protein [Baekduia sp.]|nr:YihY/virulence factor BrkB family protein [Baekduia sp.]